MQKFEDIKRRLAELNKGIIYFDIEDYEAIHNKYVKGEFKEVEKYRETLKTDKTSLADMFADAMCPVTTTRHYFEDDEGHIIVMTVELGDWSYFSTKYLLCVYDYDSPKPSNRPFTPAELI